MSSGTGHVGPVVGQHIGEVDSGLVSPILKSTRNESRNVEFRHLSDEVRGLRHITWNYTVRVRTVERQKGITRLSLLFSTRDLASLFNLGSKLVDSAHFALMLSVLTMIRAMVRDMGIRVLSVKTRCIASS